ncbi:MAG: MFS transporter [Planctomycetes bacterium]|nr:MFS transporter [Planctomycetota bacterium]
MANHGQLSQLRVSSPSFIGLLVAQLLGTVNDNLLRWLVAKIGMQVVGPTYERQVLAAGLACLVLPFLILAAPAGYLADRYSKRTVIVACKLGEIVIMALAIAAMVWGNPLLLFVLLAAAGAQAALFGPAKLGSIPEMLQPNQISIANGLMGMMTVGGIIIGTAGGYWLYSLIDVKGSDGVQVLWWIAARAQWWVLAVALGGVAVVGWLASLLIIPLPAENPKCRFPWNLFGQTWADLRGLWSDRALFRVSLGSGFFWALGSLANANIDIFGKLHLNLQETQIPLLLALLAMGVGVGSAMAGILSRGHVELGLVPLAATGIAIGAVMLFLVPEVQSGYLSPEYYWTAFWLFELGCCAGMYDVPLQSFIQYRSAPERRGSILAAYNFLAYTGMLSASGIFAILGMPVGQPEHPLFSAQAIFLIAGVATLPVALYAYVLLPQATIRFVVWVFSTTIYKVRVFNVDRIPATGPAVLAPNHVSWIDGVLLMITSSRPLRMMLYADYAERWYLRGLAKLMGAIPIRAGDRRSVIEALRRAREALEAGEVVCIFPEGRLSRSGQLQAFQPGILSVIKSTGAPVVPVYLDELWGSIFSFHGGKLLGKWPRQWRYPVSIHFGEPLVGVQDVETVRSAVQQLGVVAVTQRKTREPVLTRRMIRSCKRQLFRSKVADSLGTDMTGGQFLARALTLRRILRRDILAPDEKYVAILVPTSAAAVVTNAALALDRRIAVNLNYTASAEVMNSCLRQCGIKHVLASRKLLDKLNVKLDAEIVVLDDLKNTVKTADKAVAALLAFATPTAVLERLLGLRHVSPDDTLVVIFTSGSTGEPKGVVLSYHNVGSNVEAIDSIVQLTRQDVLLGAVPFFHSLGYTTTMWTVLTMHIKGAYHFSPLDTHEIAKLCQRHKGTVIITAPTFLRSFLRRADVEEMRSLEVVVAGAEKLPVDLCDAFEKKFNVRPVEGYGTTECSPLVAVNIPARRAPPTDEVVAKEGTVGRPIPGVAAKVINAETGEQLGFDTPGLLLVRGPNVMQGYLNRDDLTAKVMRDGWYNTGDVAMIDADGFIKITGRESRFSKLAGEMVPHIGVEEAIQQVIGAEQDKICVAVTAVPDARKGERLVVIHTELAQTPDQIVKQLGQLGLPNLWIPSADSFFQVEQIPVLGTGKLDLKGLKTLALRHFAPEAAKA